MYQVKLEKSYFPAQTNLAVEEKTVGEVLSEAASRDPDRTALVELIDDGTTGRKWCYQKLYDEALLVARFLASHFKAGQRVAVWAPNSPEWVIVEFACAFAGLTLVTVNPAFQPKELKYVLDQSRASGIIYLNEYRGNPMGQILKSVTDEMENELSSFVITDIIDLAKNAYEKGETNEPLPEVKPTDIAQIQYTSGTTGFPKGALLYHRGLVNNSRHLFKCSGIEEKSRYLTMWPLFHTAGCSASVLGCVQQSMTNYIMPIFIPDALNRVIEEEKINASGGVPTMVTAMLESNRQKPRDFSSLTYFFGAGSMVSPELSRATYEAWNLNLCIIYGQTEAHPVITMTIKSDTLIDRTQTIGQPAEQTDVAIMDPESKEIMPLDVQGEICCRGYLVMPGYNDNPQATAETIDEEGWLHTGDLGSMDARGYIKITGRVKEMIIRGGENLFPAEIENTLLEHADVAEVTVVGLPDDKFGEIVGAFIRLKEGASADADMLKAHCRSEMSAQKTPAVWQFVDAFPLTGSGKIKRFELRDQWIKENKSE